MCRRILQCLCSILALEALEAPRRLIKQKNHLIVKCWAGIKEINVQVPALEVLTLGEAISTPASPLSTKPLQNYWWQNLSADARGKDHSKDLSLLLLLLFSLIPAMRHRLVLFMILWRKIFCLKGIKPTMRYLWNNITCFYWFSTILLDLKQNSSFCFSRSHHRKPDI